MERTRLLITGFPPFSGRPINPSQQIIAAIQTGQIHVPEQYEVLADLLPVDYLEIEREFDGMVDAFRPQLVLAFGVGHRGPLLHLEQWAFNLDDSPVPDNAGRIRQQHPIVTQGPLQLPVTLDVVGLSGALSDAGIDVTLSQSAGRFLCNHLLYYGLNRAPEFDPRYRMTFVHVRPLDLSGGDRAVEPSAIFSAVETLLMALARD